MFRKLLCIIPVLAMLFVPAPANALLEDWENAIDSASPVFSGTNVTSGAYNIGTYGNNQTYEFVVKSNPDERHNSMALIGRRDLAASSTPDGVVVTGGMALKYEQFLDTRQYGVTLYGIADYTFGVYYTPGVDTHLVFVSSQDLGTCTLYVNGVPQASVPVPINLSGRVGIGYTIQTILPGLPPYIDEFDGVIYGVAIYNRILSNSEIQAHSNAYFLPPRELMLAEAALYIMDQVDLGNIAPELKESLLVKIDAALAALHRGNPNEAKVAINDLKALINQVEAQTDKKITPQVAAEIIRQMNAIVIALGG